MYTTSTMYITTKCKRQTGDENYFWIVFSLYYIKLVILVNSAITYVESENVNNNNVGLVLSYFLKWKYEPRVSFASILVLTQQLTNIFKIYDTRNSIYSEFRRRVAENHPDVE